MPSPPIAVPAYHLKAGRVTGWDDEAEAVPRNYVDAFRRAGVRPAMLAAPEPGGPAEVLAPFSGLALLGGGDVDPSRYADHHAPEVYGIDEERDELELALACHAVDTGLPVLAICRGLQVLNVALGGTLHQHLPSVGIKGHGAPDAAGEPRVHDVVVEPESRLAAALGHAGGLSGCVSIHHQAPDEIAPILVAVARSRDGLIEGLETGPAAPWVLAVQWHPERTAASDQHQQAIFDAFGRACAAAAEADRLARK
jgi:putative glutamine amidotransferase